MTFEKMIEIYIKEHDRIAAGQIKEVLTEFSKIMLKEKRSVSEEDIESYMYITAINNIDYLRVVGAINVVKDFVRFAEKKNWFEKEH